jgi:hypothetical protein
VVAVAVGVWQYRLTSLREFIKPVREAQLKLYQEPSSAAAQIATLQQESPEWIKARQEFLRLYYSHWRSSKASIMRPRAVKDSRSNAP